ncbi:hypothetical protein [Flavobacterium sp. J372]|uniref:hypothetical protein n=1 Tax=Flavobacterium sp. J372 TaxID=2898436 RepID=UPI0027E22901|nr:hypothetical protein [Flavobacterium sp. J372]
MKKFILAAVIILPMLLSAQSITRRDTLQGGLRPERTSFDVQRYDLNITIDPDKRYISGYNDITFGVVEKHRKYSLTSLKT